MDGYLTDIVKIIYKTFTLISILKKFLSQYKLVTH